MVEMVCSDPPQGSFIWGHDLNVGSDRDQVSNDGVMEAREGSSDLKGRTVQLGFTDLADKAKFRCTLES